MKGSAYMLLDFHLHQGLRERPHPFLEKFRVAFAMCALRKSFVSPVLSSSAIVAYLLLSSLIHFE